MANTKQIKTKIKSVSNLQKIIKALEVVSTVKLQKVKQKTLDFTNFIKYFLEVLNAIQDQVDVFAENNQLVAKNKKSNKGKKLIIVVSTDKGLCGPLNSKITKHLWEKYGVDEKIKKNVDVFVIGKKGLDFFVSGGWNVVGTLNIQDDFNESDLNKLFVFIKQALEQQTYSKIKIYFNFFKNIITQVPMRFKLYPLDRESFESFLKNMGESFSKTRKPFDDHLILEPNPEDFAKSLIDTMIRNVIYFAVLNNITSEQASRMLAMKNAKDNCIDIVSLLQIMYNKIRQQKITQEISEIVGGLL